MLGRAGSARSSATRLVVDVELTQYVRPSGEKPALVAEDPSGVLAFSTGWRQSCETS
jgi:hypothetical protein